MENDCPTAINECASQCSHVKPVNILNSNGITSTHQSACFQFISHPKNIHMSCICADGSSPTFLSGFKLVSRMDGLDGKQPGHPAPKTSAATSLISSHIFLIVVFVLLALSYSSF